MRSRLLTLILAAPLLLTIPDRSERRFDRKIVDFSRSAPTIDPAAAHAAPRSLPSSDVGSGNDANQAAGDGFCVSVLPSQQTIVQSQPRAAEATRSSVILLYPQRSSGVVAQRWLCVSPQTSDYIALGRSILSRIARLEGWRLRG